MPLILSLVQELLHTRNVIVLVSWMCLYVLLKHWLQQQSSLYESPFILEYALFHNPDNSVARAPFSTFLLPFIFQLMGLDKELSENPVSLETPFSVSLYFVRVSVIISWTTFKSTVCPAWLRNLLNQTNVANLSAIPQASNIEFIHNILIFSIHEWSVATKKYSNWNKKLATCKMLQGFHIQYVATKKKSWIILMEGCESVVAPP